MLRVYFHFFVPRFLELGLWAFGFKVFGSGLSGFGL